ncbi:hypothetical protein TRVL_06383 [Trypanosoma vivax]|nr:hypothetical protein TRVL_06383 [Trypanosoma vivax]
MKCESGGIGADEECTVTRATFGLWERQAVTTRKKERRREGTLHGGPWSREKGQTRSGVATMPERKGQPKKNKQPHVRPGSKGWRDAGCGESEGKSRETARSKRSTIGEDAESRGLCDKNWLERPCRVGVPEPP